MRMAIVHDGLLHVGGAEKVLFELVDLFPQADLFIPIINQELRPILEKKTSGKIFTTFLSQLPFLYPHASLVKPLLIFYWEKLNLAGYDFVLTSSHSFNSKLVNVPRATPHLSYVYTPPRYLSQHFSEITALKKPITSWLAKPLLNWLKSKDQISGQKPTVLVGISKVVQQRIEATYHRPSLLIYPPVSIPKFTPRTSKLQYYLCFSRLVKQKGIALAVKTFTKLNLPLVVVGDGPELARLQALAGPTISFKGFVSDRELEQIFSQSIALVNCALEEDFGLVTVEAAARGIPVIAYRSGGLTETVLENVTGVFFNQHTVKSLAAAIKKFNQLSIKSEDCYRLAQQFSRQIFRKKMVTLVKYLRKYV